MEPIVFAVLIGISLCLALYSAYRIHAEVPAEDRTYLDRPPLLLRLLWPLIRLVAHYFGGLVGERAGARIQARLRRAGQDYALNPEQFFAARIVSVLFAAGMSWFLLAALHKETVAAVSVFAALGYLYPDLWLKETTDRRNRAILKALPFYLDVVTPSVEGGLNLTGGLAQAADKGPDGPLKLEFNRVLRDIRAGKPKTDAMRDMADRLDMPAIGSLVSALIQAETMGMSLGPVLRAQADQRRAERFQRAEKLAMEAPVKMLAPLVMFIFPNTFIILGFPIVMKFLKSGIL